MGYVGLPLAVAFAEKFQVVGFDISNLRIKELKSGHDRTLEVEVKLLNLVKDNLMYTTNIQDAQDCDIYIVTVPTPVDTNNSPNLTPLIESSKAIGTILSQNDIVIYESTVYPGVTEDICVPELEKSSGLVFNQDFFCGYSPERINPGDKSHTVTKILKVTSGSTPEVAKYVDSLYKKIIVAGTYMASSIKVAEASKVVENTQRDVNIALINELALIFNEMGIDTNEVIEAASTKWNFIKLTPGLVGGHCIGVDPCYLTHKAFEVGYHPEIILAGRRLNDSMGSYVAEQVAKLMNKKRIHVVDANVLVMGFTFKENCPDIRNTRVIDLINELESVNCNVDVYDPWIDKSATKKEYGIIPIHVPEEGKYDAIILAVAHDEFKNMGILALKKLAKANHVIYDIKYILPKTDVEGRL